MATTGWMTWFTGRWMAHEQIAGLPKQIGNQEYCVIGQISRPSLQDQMHTIFFFGIVNAYEFTMPTHTPTSKRGVKCQHITLHDSAVHQCAFHQWTTKKHTYNLRLTCGPSDRREFFVGTSTNWHLMGCLDLKHVNHIGDYNGLKRKNTHTRKKEK